MLNNHNIAIAMPTMPSVPSVLTQNCYPDNCKVVQPLGAGFVGNTSTIGLIRPM